MGLTLATAVGGPASAGAAAGQSGNDRATVWRIRSASVFAMATWSDPVPDGWRETTVSLIRERFTWGETRSRRRGVSVTTRVDGPDPRTGRDGYTVWQGSAPLTGAQHRLRRDLRSARVDAEVLLKGERCNYDLHRPGVTCSEVEPRRVRATVRWTGTGALETYVDAQRSREDGFRVRYRSRGATREAVAVGSVSSGGTTLTSGDAWAFLSRDTSATLTWSRSR